MALAKVTMQWLVTRVEQAYTILQSLLFIYNVLKTGQVYHISITELTALKGIYFL